MFFSGAQRDRKPSFASFDIFDRCKKVVFCTLAGILSVPAQGVNLVKAKHFIGFDKIIFQIDRPGHLVEKLIFSGCILPILMF